MAFVPFTKEDQPTMANFNAKFLEAILEGKEQALSAGTKIATGSYTGTGTYGESNPCSLTFDFEPKLIFMDVGNTAMLYTDAAWVKPIPTIFYHGVTTAYSSDDNYKQVVTWSGNTVSWYSKDTGVNALRQMNVSGRTYKYIAIG